QRFRRKRLKDQSGIALFMVLSAIGVRALLVTEFTYVSQLNQKIAYDGFHRLQALYLAKSGLKLSLLRLKAYKTVNGFLKKDDKKGGAPPVSVPKTMVEQIWSFPLVFPIPSELPGLSATQKSAIEKFTE